MWSPNGQDVSEGFVNPHIENEVKILNFLIHNEAKIMYALRHNSKRLYTFDVNQYVDIMNIIKKKKFGLLETGPDEATILETKKIVFEIFDIINKNVKLL